MFVNYLSFSQEITCVTGDCQNGFGKAEYLEGQFYNVYEGNFLNGRKHGKGRLFKKSTSIGEKELFEGYWENGIFTGNGVYKYKKNGTGEQKYSQDYSYKGEFLNGQKHGQGLFTDNLKNISFEVIYVNDEMHKLKDKLSYENSCNYSGWIDAKTGEPYGKGEIKFPDGTKVIGSWENGQLTKNNCQCHYADGGYYEGLMYIGGSDQNIERFPIRHGSGVFTSSDGTKFKGNFTKNLADGYFTINYNDGAQYIGYCKKGQKQGKGKLTFPDGRWYNGEWNEDNCHGAGEWREKNGFRWAGTWKLGKMNGEFMVRKYTALFGDSYRARVTMENGEEINRVVEYEYVYETSNNEYSYDNENDDDNNEVSNLNENCVKEIKMNYIEDAGQMCHLVICTNGDSHEIYYSKGGTFSSEGYYKMNYLNTTYLGKDIEKAKKKVCGCD